MIGNLPLLIGTLPVLSIRKTTLAGRSIIRRGFTLMELMVAVSLLMLMILAIARIFRDASRAVSMSQASLEMFSNVRAVQEQIASDISGLDRNTFLVIRSKYDPTDLIRSGPLKARRWDQLAFVANGTFANRTGTALPNPFADSTSSNAALVWYGHGLVIPDNATNSQGTAVGLFDAPTGTSDKEFVLLRHATLLMAPNGATNLINVGGVNIPAYDNPSRTTGQINVDGAAADITASRVAVAAMTPGQLMQNIMRYKGANTRFEVDNFCFRFKVLTDPYQSNISLVNGTFRMHPILLQGDASFKVEWTDGTINTVYGDGRLMWYGLGNNKAVDAANGYTTALNTLTQPTPGSGDTYTAAFSFDNRYRSNGASNWPKALKITYRVTDPMDKLQGGREFVQVLKLPN